MLKTIRKSKKILAIIILFITLFGIVQPVFAANQTISGSGTDKFMGRQYATKLKTTDESNSGANGIIARRLIRRNENWNFSNGDGILVFCAQLRSAFCYTERITKAHTMYRQQQN